MFKYLLIGIVTAIISFSANATVLAEKTELSKSDIEWINKHRSDKLGGTLQGFSWIKLDGNIYSMPTKLFKLHCSGGKQCAQNLFKSHITAQIKADIKKTQEIKDKVNNLAVLFESKGFTKEETLYLISILIKEVKIK